MMIFYIPFLWHFSQGVNMAASAIVDVRQVYANGALAALGMFEVSFVIFTGHRDFLLKLIPNE